MMLLANALTKIRHGPLSRFRFVWVVARQAYRGLLTITPGWTVGKNIGPYGPFRLDRRFAFSNFAAWGGGHNRGFVSCVESSRGKGCVLDIGAHIGLVTLPLSTVIAEAGTVYSFEPAEANRYYLDRHVRANHMTNVQIVPYLVGESRGDAVEFYEDSNDSGMNSLSTTGVRRGYSPKYKRQTTVDLFCAELNLTPDIIKIDTEGAELHIIKGAIKTLRRARPTIYLSVHPQLMADLGSSLSELTELLKELKYRITDMDGNLVSELHMTEYLVAPEDR